MTSKPHHTRRGSALSPALGWRVRRGLVGTIRVACRVLRGLVAATTLLALTAGVPWALWHYVGWPLPDHVLTWTELQVVLLSPITAEFVLDVIACACWIWWAAFALDVVACTVDAARRGFDAARSVEFSAAGPTQALAGVLVGSILMAVLGNRLTLAASAPLSATLGAGAPVVATAPAWHHPTPGTEALEGRSSVAPAGGAGDVSTRPESVVVLAPQDGVHDSLWRIAQRTLGDGARWPEIFELNKGKPQPNGHAFTQPSLIFPGEELTLPHKAHAPTPPPADQAPNSPAPPSTSSAPSTSLQPSTPAPPAPSTPQAPPSATSRTPAPQAADEPGFRWGAELFVSLGLAAAVSATLMLARRRHRSRYRPGSGDRDDLPVAPVVYQLRLAHLRTEAHNEIGLDDEADDEHQQRPRPVSAAPPLVVGAHETGAGCTAVLTPGVGVRDGREIALDLAAARGLGLVGAGAPAAARALLIEALTTSPHHLATSAGTVVIVPVGDLVSMLGREARHLRLPSTVRVVRDLDSALDAVEAEILVRATASREPGAEPRMWPPLVLVVQPPALHLRLQAVLDTGAPFGVTGLLLGQWQPGVTCYVRADGTISATGPGLGEALRGTQVFRLGGDDTTQLLNLLHQAEPQPDAPDTSYLPDLPPAPHTPVAATPPAGNDHTVPSAEGPLETRPSSTSEIELKVTAAATQPAPSDTQPEILDPSPAQGLRKRQQRPDRADVVGAEKEHPQPGALTDDPAPADGHTEPVAATPPAFAPHHEDDTDAAQITVTVLGGLRVHWHPEPHPATSSREITGTLQPRTQELLVFLALHPDGVTRDPLVSALWSHDPPARPTNALHTALARMRTALAAATNGAVTDIVSTSNGRYQLDPAVVSVDYRRFAHAVAARRAATTDQARIDALWDVVNAYGGTLAEDTTAEWIEPVREAIRRDAVDAVAALARALVDTDPQQTLDLLEVARAFDPHNEPLYRDIMRLQERLGQIDAIPRTLTLLSARLAELDAAPTPQARGLAAQLGQRHEDKPAGPASSHAQGTRDRSTAS
ncbi:DNA-binding transcriptional activator of the SARP family [Lentzea albidocapillata subsp. violacea]|uniref:DNA-binding transcriptional activator of the SARP family n=1 Tax=Lentzea albidocapillata subsp. violacea TaxID=128104 RepID=A0A1G9RTB7_9PSEU|nr:BTAD domain-containing putative transcriptional regulator [Lentzea albidocapillata]SDM26412.1 DNA-binding transcriptional activator of the SARP family [Lentzea albidocapillata subsp. violacea]